MLDFCFDDSKNFGENCKTFLETVTADDSEIVAILIKN
jgi:hypothetical protein